MREGLCDQVRLLRYVQRAWSRCKRAVRAFMASNWQSSDQAMDERLRGNNL